MQVIKKRDIQERKAVAQQLHTKKPLVDPLKKTEEERKLLKALKKSANRSFCTSTKFNF